MSLYSVSVDLNPDHSFRRPEARNWCGGEILISGSTPYMVTDHTPICSSTLDDSPPSLPGSLDNCRVYM